jgi:hypothetical protein
MKIFFVSICVMLSMTAQAADFFEVARFENAAQRGAGWVVLDTASGQYVYGDSEEKNSRVITGKPFLIGAIERKDYEFFSYQEEEALWLVMQDQIAVIQPKPKRGESATANLKGVDWPRVVVRGDEVCVPVLESAKADDWREHLTCTEVSRND